MNKISFKKKNRILIMAGCCMLVFSYFLAFKKTIQLYLDSSALERKAIISGNAENEIIQIREKLEKLGNISGVQSGRRDLNIQQALLNAVSNYCQNNKIILREFPKAISSDEKGFHIDTYLFTVEGGFIKLLELIYMLEQKNKIGRIASANFQTKEDLRTKSITLNSTVYVQVINKISNEK